MAKLSADLDQIGHGTGPSSGRNAFAQVAADRSGDILPLYELEGQVLTLWDQLNELKLEKTILEVQVGPGGARGERSLDDNNETVSEVELAEKQCLEARADYMLRQSVVEDTLIASPILNAIHAGSNANGSERALRPLLTRRDTLEVASTNLATSLQAVMSEATKRAADNLAAMDRNRALAVSLTALTDMVKDRTKAATQKPEVAVRLGRLQEEAETARRRWTIMKRVIAAVIAGSGVDWTHDGELTDLVLDPEDEECCDDSPLRYNLPTRAAN
ncbi:MAG: hypothetical protein Q9163_003701 [Psora crenata]